MEEQPHSRPIIDDRKQMEVLLHEKNQILEMLARGEPLRVVLDDICLLVERFFPGAYVSVLLLQPDGTTLRKVASPSSPPAIAGFLEAGVPVDENTGPCGRAAFTLKPEIIEDLNWYQRDAAFRELLEAHDLVAAWSLPIISPSLRFLGTLSLYLPYSGTPDAKDHAILEQMMHLAAVAIEQAQAREKLRRNEALLATAQRLTLTGSFNWNAVTNEMTWSDETYRICEVDQSVTPTGEMTRDLFHPDDLPFFYDMIMGKRRDYDFECRLKLPSGIKYIQVVGVAERDASGKLREWTGTFMDITQRKRTADALRASEHLARRQVEALSETLALMSTESDPGKVLEHVLRVILRQLDAHSLALWETNAAGDGLEQITRCENGRMDLATLDEIAGIPRVRIPMAEHPIWTEFFRDGQRIVLGDLSQRPMRVRFADTDETQWHDSLSSLEAHPDVAAVLESLFSDGVVSSLYIPMLLAGRVIALISIRFRDKRTFDRGELALAHALAHQATLAMQLGRLSQQSQRTAVIAERNRLARDIHDTLAQGLTGIIIQLRAAKDASAHKLGKEAEAHLLRAAELASESLREARRSVRALRPRALEEGELIDALEAMFVRLTADTSMEATLAIHGHPIQLTHRQEETVLRVSQEILTNALKHAHATLLSVRVDYQPECFKIEFRDDGDGFNPQDKTEGFGLIGIRERIAAVGGTMILESSPGRGTLILLSLPIFKVSTPFLP